jgi:hypothetical protein
LLLLLLLLLLSMLLLLLLVLLLLLLLLLLPLPLSCTVLYTVLYCTVRVNIFKLANYCTVLYVSLEALHRTVANVLTEVRK